MTQNEFGIYWTGDAVKASIDGDKGWVSRDFPGSFRRVSTKCRVCANRIAFIDFIVEETPNECG